MCVSDSIHVVLMWIVIEIVPTLLILAIRLITLWVHLEQILVHTEPMDALTSAKFGKILSK